MKEKRYEHLFRELSSRLMNLDMADLVLVSDVMDAVSELKGLSPLPGKTDGHFDRLLVWLKAEFSGRIKSPNEAMILTSFLDFMVDLFNEAPGIINAGQDVPEWMIQDLDRIWAIIPEAVTVEDPDPETESQNPQASLGDMARQAMPIPEPGELEPSGAHESPVQMQAPDVTGIFFHEARERLKRAQTIVVDMEKDRDPDLMNELFRIYHTIKGEAGFLGFPSLGALSHQLENLLDRIRQGLVEVGSVVTDLLLEGTDIAQALLEEASAGGIAAIKGCTECDDFVGRLSTWLASHMAPLGNVLVEQGLLKPEDVRKILAKQEESAWQKRFGEITVEEKFLSPGAIEDALALQRQTLAGKLSGMPAGSGKAPAPTQVVGAVPVPATGAAGGQKEAVSQHLEQLTRTLGAKLAATRSDPGSAPPPMEEFVNVKASQIRFLIDQIGELLITLQQLDESDRTVISARKISRNLQFAAMQLGTVKIGSLSAAMKRVARDAAKQTGKDFDLILEGENIEVDRNLVERLNEPVMHLLRNAVSHGLEAGPGERQAAGKPVKGIITLKAERRGHQVVISVADDGRGLESARILAKAVEQGLVSAEAGRSMSPEQIREFIFKPGFSTAAQVDSMSGRGVGMDVVRNMVSTLRGSIHLDTLEGSFTRVMLMFPINMAIIEGMIIGLAGRNFVIPVSNIIETMELQDSMFHVLQEGVRVLSLRGETIPVLDLARWFGLPPAEEGSRRLGIIIESHERRYAFLVHEIVSKREVVIKPLGPLFDQLRGVSSGTILQRGRIGLVIDVDEIVRTE